MKKFLTISFALLLTSATMTGCGADKNNNSDAGSYYEDHDYGHGNSDRYDDDNNGSNRNSGDTVKDDIHDAIDGVENAGEDIVSGVGDAANDIVDGFGDDESRTESTSSETTETSR
ncbi:MAG: hypothetical protein K2H19_04840 [Ruminococcus sp.]|nr:hypothetical protein [Ruminococcus sp.]